MPCLKSVLMQSLHFILCNVFLWKVELNSPESLAYKLSLYRGYLALCPPEEQHFTAVTKLVEAASNQAIKQWKRLPSIVSSVHITFLQV